MQPKHQDRVQGKCSSFIELPGYKLCLAKFDSPSNKWVQQAAVRSLDSVFFGQCSQKGSLMQAWCWA